MDATTARLIDFAAGLDYARLHEDTVHECKRRLIDAIGCAIGAYDDHLSVMARAMAGRVRGDPAASILGSKVSTSPEAAAFTNGVMIRLADISDTYLGKARGHPSDMLSGILAVGETVRANGQAIIAATTLAYDIYCSLCDALDWNSKGWDQPVYATLGCVVGVGKLLELDREQMANAISLALVPNMAMAQTRRGPLSSWKGCAGPNGSRNAVFAAMLARDGFTGPTAIFEGEGGIFDIVGKFEWTLPQGGQMIGKTHIKSLPVCYHGQSPVLVALKMREQVRAQDIAAIRVDAYKTAVDMMGGDPSRWAPTTHETADHSLPYTVSIAFLDGKVNEESYATERFTDPAVVAMMKKVEVHEDAGLTAKYPQASPGRLTVKMVSGEVHTSEMIYPTGHAGNPMSDAEVEAKFQDMLAQRYDAAERDRLLKRLWAAEKIEDFGREVLAPMAK